MITERDAQIIEASLALNEEGRAKTLVQIGEQFGVSRERIRQILKKNGVKKPAVGVKTKKCKSLNCEKRVPWWGDRRYCAEHKWEWRAQLITLTCTHCGTDIIRPESEVLQHDTPNAIRKNRTDNFFCSKRCHGQWLGKTHGFLVNPANRFDRKERTPIS